MAKRFDHYEMLKVTVGNLNSPGPMMLVVVVTSLLFTLCGCSRAISWEEEVLLPGGARVHVRNVSDYETFSEISGPGALFAKEVRLQIMNQTPSIPRWTESLEPVLLMRDPGTGQFVLVATTGDARAWNARGKPQPPYWQFRAGSDRWIEEPLSDFVFGLRTNLLLNPYWAKETRSPIKPEAKDALRIKFGATFSKLTIEKQFRFGKD